MLGERRLEFASGETWASGGIHAVHAEQIGGGKRVKKWNSVGRKVKKNGSQVRHIKDTRK